jgi:hypothetical protein
VTTRLTIHPGRVFRVLVLAVVFLAIAHITVRFFYHRFHPWDPLEFARLFNLSEEMNIPTFFSSTLLLIAFGLLMLIGCAKRMMKDRYARHWLVLSAVLLNLAIDEASVIHENLGRVFQPKWLHIGHHTLYGWVPVMGLMAFIIGVAMLRFVLQLPGCTRRLIFLSGAVYLGAAGGMELVGCLLHGLSYSAEIVVEECGEMVAIIILIYALLSYIRDYMPGLQVTFSDQG